MKKIPGLERARFAFMRGSFLQNESYCSKQGTLHHFGGPPVGQGARTDKNTLYGLLKEGKTVLQLMDADFSAYCRFQRGIAEYQSLSPPVRTSPIEVLLFYGPPGCGKTELAESQFPDTYRLPIGKNFWLTPYAVGKKHILIDDFKANLSLADLLQLIDNSCLEVERKGSHLWWCPETVIFTTNRSPHDWYDYSTRDYEKEALFRRFSSCYVFAKNDERVPRPVSVDMTDPNVFKKKIVLTCQQLRGPSIDKEIYV